MINNLPDELLVEVWWTGHPLNVLNSRLVCKHFKEIIDSSTKVQLLIELYRDDLYPALHTIEDIKWKDADFNLNSIITTKSFHGLLQSQLQNRKRWEDFNPRLDTCLSLYDQTYDLDPCGNRKVAA